MKFNAIELNFAENVQNFTAFEKGSLRFVISSPHFL